MLPPVEETVADLLSENRLNLETGILVDYNLVTNPIYSNITLPHMPYVLYGMFTYIWLKLMVNVYKYSSPIWSIYGYSNPIITPISGAGKHHDAMQVATRPNSTMVWVPSSSKNSAGAFVVELPWFLCDFFTKGT